MSISVKPFFRNKAQEKAWRKSFTPENHAAARKLKRDLQQLGPHGVAKRDKAEHLAREASADRHAVAEARAQFAQAVELKHGMYGATPGWEHLKSDWPHNEIQSRHSL